MQNEVMQGMQKLLILDYTSRDKRAFRVFNMLKAASWLSSFMALMLSIMIPLSAVPFAIYIFIRYVFTAELYRPHIVMGAIALGVLVVLIAAFSIARRRLDELEKDAMSHSPVCRELAQAMGVDHRVIYDSVTRFMDGLDYQFVTVKDKRSGATRTAGLTWGVERRTIDVWAPIA